ncbi:hypothetical protein V6N13_019755 [Hibiscus sabdariffa]|uniref:Uncharacterized protein n=1 Tax=Hibiscus sabdariffa TaxID=183260 RepID=A0ABR2NRW1_9ROSI
MCSHHGGSENGSLHYLVEPSEVRKLELKQGTKLQLASCFGSTRLKGEGFAAVVQQVEEFATKEKPFTRPGGTRATSYEGLTALVDYRRGISSRFVIIGVLAIMFKKGPTVSTERKEKRHPHPHPLEPLSDPDGRYFTTPTAFEFPFNHTKPKPPRTKFLVIRCLLSMPSFSLSLELSNRELLSSNNLYSYGPRTKSEQLPE